MGRVNRVLLIGQVPGNAGGVLPVAGQGTGWQQRPFRGTVGAPQHGRRLQRAEWLRDSRTADMLFWHFTLEDVCTVNAGVF